MNVQTAVATTTLAGVVAELEALAQSNPDEYGYSSAQLLSAVTAYQKHTGHDLSTVTLTLDLNYPVDVIDPGYNYTPDNSIAEYTARWTAAGRLHGEDLECQVGWYTRLVHAASAGVLPPGLVHEVDGKAVIVDGGHRQSAYRSAGLLTSPVYVARTLPGSVR